MAATSSANLASITTVTITIPTGIAVGDLVIIACRFNGAGITMSQTTSTGGTLTTLYNGNQSGGIGSVCIFSRIATSIDISGNTYSFLISAAGTGSLSLIVYSGNNPSIDIYSSVPSGNGATTCTVSTITTNFTGYLLCVSTTRGNASGSSNNISATGYTFTNDFGTNPGNNCEIDMLRTTTTNAPGTTSSFVLSTTVGQNISGFLINIYEQASTSNGLFFGTNI